MVHFGGEDGEVAIPVAITADKPHGRIDELRVYHSTWPLTGRHVNRPPLLDRLALHAPLRQPGPVLAHPRSRCGPLQASSHVGLINAAHAIDEARASQR